MEYDINRFEFVKTQKKQKQKKNKYIIRGRNNSQLSAKID